MKELNIRFASENKRFTTHQENNFYSFKFIYLKHKMLNYLNFLI